MQFNQWVDGIEGILAFLLYVGGLVVLGIVLSKEKAFINFQFSS
jgi:hypothetical protein